MKCSVIVACYNNPDLIVETLRSIENQTYQNWELVLVEDCSTDHTLEVLKKHIYASSFEQKYKLIALSENGGVSHAKGTGIRNSCGEIIVICDHDDTLAPNALEEIVKAHRLYPEASIVHAQHYTCNAQLKPLKIERSISQVTYSDILEDKISHLLSYKRSSYHKTSGYDAFFRVADDKDIIYKLEEVGDTVFLEKPLYYFRISNRGASQGFDNFIRSRDEKLVAARNAIERRSKSLVKQLPSSALNKFLGEVHLLQAEGILYANQRLGLKFLAHLSQSIRYHPTGNLKRKLKTLLLLTRLKRTILGIFGKK